MSKLLTLPVIEGMIGCALRNQVVTGFESLPGGLINNNLRVHLENGTSVVLRIYRDGAGACHKEVALHQLVQETVPVAAILHAQPDGLEGSTAFAILEYVDAITFQQLRRTNDRQAIADASSSVGQTLAAIGRNTFDKPGRIQVEGQQLRIGEPFVEGDDGISKLVASFLESSTLQHRLDHNLIQTLRGLFNEWSPRLAEFNNDRSLVHCDFGNRNLLVSQKSGRWQVAAVLDWELAISGTPLLDVGNFLRYDYADPMREPHFSRAFVEHGGHLPDDWQNIVRVLDLGGLIECLTHESLPVEIETEILQLIDATVKRTLFPV